MLMNNLDPEVAERPEDLVVYGGTGKAARNWEAYDAIVATLATLGDDETLLVQSGKPVGVFRTHADAPRVLIANSMLVPKWADWDTFRELEDARADDVRPDDRGLVDLHRHAGDPAGHLRDVRRVRGRQHFGGTLAGTVMLTGGLGGMGGAQPLAVTMNGGVRSASRSTRRASSAGSRPATSTARPTTSTTRSRGPTRRRPRGEAVSIGLRRQRRRGARRSSLRARRRGPTSSPTRPARTIRWAATCRPG